MLCNARLMMHWDRIRHRNNQRQATQTFTKRASTITRTLRNVLHHKVFSKAECHRTRQSLFWTLCRIWDELHKICFTSKKTKHQSYHNPLKNRTTCQANRHKRCIHQTVRQSQAQNCSLKTRVNSLIARKKLLTLHLGASITWTLRWTSPNGNALRDRRKKSQKLFLPTGSHG